jgi:hypothetical protein
MNTHMRYALLILAVLLGVMNPPNRPPGSRPMKAESRPAAGPVTARCPYPDCPQGKGRRRKELVYRCDSCNRVSYYCLSCERLYPRGEEGQHNHNSPAV